MEVESAGTKESFVRPERTEVVLELGIDISAHRSPETRPIGSAWRKSCIAISKIARRRPATKHSKQMRSGVFANQRRAYLLGFLGQQAADNDTR